MRHQQPERTALRHVLLQVLKCVQGLSVITQTTQLGHKGVVVEVEQLVGSLRPQLWRQRGSEEVSQVDGGSGAAGELEVEHGHLGEGGGRGGGPENGC